MGSDADAARGLAQSRGAAVEAASLIVGHFRLELTGGAAPPDDRRQPDRHVVTLPIAMEGSSLRRGCAATVRARPSGSGHTAAPSARE